MNDIALLKNPIKRFSGLNNIEMVLGGYTGTDPVSKEYWDKVHSMFTNGNKLANRKLNGTLPNNYMTLFEHADIMVIPLEDSQGHACKSHWHLYNVGGRRMGVHGAA